MIMLFGKYKGCDINTVPQDYLEWMLNNNRKTVVALEQELERRALAEEANENMITRLIKEGYRSLSKKHHPDFGGSEEAMKEVNAAKAKTDELLG